MNIDPETHWADWWTTMSVIVNGEDKVILQGTQTRKNTQTHAKMLSGWLWLENGILLLNPIEMQFSSIFMCAELSWLALGVGSIFQSSKTPRTHTYNSAHHFPCKAIVTKCKQRINIYQKLNFSHLIYCCVVMLTTYFYWFSPILPTVNRAILKRYSQCLRGFVKQTISLLSLCVYVYEGSKMCTAYQLQRWRIMIYIFCKGKS